MFYVVKILCLKYVGFVIVIIESLEQAIQFGVSTGLNTRVNTGLIFMTSTSLVHLFTVT